MQEFFPANFKFDSSSCNHDDDRNDTNCKDEMRGESTVLSFCMNIDWGNDEYQGEKTPNTQENKIRRTQSLLRADTKVTESSHSTTLSKSSILDRDRDRKTEMLIFRRLSDSFQGVVSRFTWSSSDERENSTSTLRDEDFYWLSASNSWMSQSTTSETEEVPNNTN